MKILNWRNLATHLGEAPHRQQNRVHLQHAREDVGSMSGGGNRSKGWSWRMRSEGGDIRGLPGRGMEVRGARGGRRRTGEVGWPSGPSQWPDQTMLHGDRCLLLLDARRRSDPRIGR